MATKPDINDGQDGWGGGWSLHNSVRMAPNQYASAINARIVADGDLSARQGCRRYTASPLGSGAWILGGFSWRQAGSTSDLLVANGHLYTALCDSWGGGSGRYLSVTDRGGGLNTTLAYSVFTSSRVAFAHFRDNIAECVYIADGQSQLSKWDGATFTPHGFGSSAVAIKYIWVYNQRLFGVTGVDQTLYWSALNNGDTLGNVAAGGGFATVRTFGAQALIGGAAIGGTNFLWHNGAISLFRGTTFDDINISAGALGLASDIGVCSPFCVVPFDGYAFILTSRGAYLLTATGSLQAFDQPNKPDPTIRDATIGGGMASQGAYNWMVHNVRYQEVWFGTTATPSSSTFSPIFAYNYRFGCWVGRFGYELPALTYLTAPWETLDAVRIPQLILGCSDGYPRAVDFPLGTSGETYLDDVLSDGSGGSVFAVTAQCRRFWTEGVPDSKQWRYLETTATLNGNTSLIATTTQQGQAPSPAAIQPPAYLAGGKPGAYHIPTGGESQFLDVAYGWSSSPNILLHKVEADGQNLGRRGVGRPSSGALIDEVTFLRLNLVGGDSAMLGCYSPGGYPLTVTFGSGVASAVADARGAAGYGPALTQATLGKRPAWDTGNQVLTFDGVTTELACAANALFAVTNQMTLVLVAEFLSAGGVVFPAGIAADLFNRFEFRNEGGATTIKGQIEPTAGPPAGVVNSGVNVGSTMRLALLSSNGQTAIIDVPNQGSATASATNPLAGASATLTLGNLAPGISGNAPMVLRAALVLSRAYSAADLATLKTWAQSYHNAVLA